MTNDKITIINKEHPEGFVPDDQYSWLKRNQRFIIEAHITLKQGELFVVGDNRDESIDSRFDGPIDSSQVAEGDIVAYPQLILVIDLLT